MIEHRRFRGDQAVGAAIGAALSWLASAPEARAQTTSGDTCAAANDEADRIVEECHPSSSEAGAPRMTGVQREECARGRLGALMTRCPTPGVLLRLGVAEGNLHHWVSAWRLLTNALATQDPFVEEHRYVIEHWMLPRVRENIVLVSPRADAPEAVLEVNGEYAGTLPLARPVAVAPGEVHVRVRAEGFEVAEVTDHRSGGAVFDVAITLVRRLPGPPAMRPMVRTPTARYVGYTLLGVGAAAALTGIGFWIVTAVGQSAMSRATSATPGDLSGYVRFGELPDVDARGRHLTWEQQCALLADRRGPDVEAAGRVCTDARRAVDVYGPVAWAAGMTGAGLIAAGVTLVMMSGRTRESTTVPRLTATVTPSYQGATLSWNF